MTHPDTHARYCPLGDRCRSYNRRTETPGPTTTAPLCDLDMTSRERDIRTLRYHWYDLAQHLAPSLSQALDSQSGFGHGSARPAPVREGVDALQRRIQWVVAAWAEVLVERERLAELPRRHARPGWVVGRAIDLLAPRVAVLAQLPAVLMADYPEIMPDRLPRTADTNEPQPSATGHDAYGSVVYAPAQPIRPPGLPPSDRALTVATFTGLDALVHLSALNSTARSMLGRTQRTTRMPGYCTCGGFLFRDEPRYPADPCDVYCDQCHERTPYDAYEAHTEAILADRTRRRSA